MHHKQWHQFSLLEPSVDMKLIMDRYLKKLPPRSSVLEIGVGSGWVSNTLHTDGHLVSCIDIAPECQKRLSPEIPVLLQDIETITDFPSEKQSLDLIIMLQVLEHVKDPLSVLQKLKPLLKPGGIFIASTPNINWLPLRLKFLFGKCPEDFHQTNHVQFWNLKRFRELFEESGYQVESQFTSLGFPNLLYPLVRKWSFPRFEIVNKYCFLATTIKSKLFGYSQAIIART